MVFSVQYHKQSTADLQAFTRATYYIMSSMQSYYQDKKKIANTPLHRDTAF
jgi:hypothetical protein